MTIRPIEAREAMIANPLRFPEPFECEYGPMREAIFEHIDQTTDQEELSGGASGQRFEW